MWYLMENVQRSYTLSERLLHAIGVGRHTSHNRDAHHIEELIRQGADVNQAHGTFLPLHCACVVGDPRIVQILLKNGADANIYDGYHRTALHHAAERSALCVQLLLSAGAETEATDINRNSPLHWAAFRNKSDACRVLLQHNAKVNAFDCNRDTPLNWASMKGNYESVRVLLEYNARPDYRNLGDMLPLTRVAILIATGIQSAQDELACELLLRAMGCVELRNPTTGRLPDVLQRDPELSERLLKLCSNPRSLMDLARFEIRRCLGQRYLPGIVQGGSLGLPERLERFVLLDF